MASGGSAERGATGAVRRPDAHLAPGRAAARATRSRCSATRACSAGASACATSGHRRRGSGVGRVHRRPAMALADALAPAVEAGLLLAAPAGRRRRLHVQPRAGPRLRRRPALERPAARGPRPRRRPAPRGGEPPADGLPMLAQHALAAGDTDRAARFSIDAAAARSVQRAGGGAAARRRGAARRLHAGRSPDPAHDAATTPTRCCGETSDRLAGPRRARRACRGAARPGARVRRPAPPRCGVPMSATTRTQRPSSRARGRPAPRAAATRDGAPRDPRARAGAPETPIGEGFSASRLEVDIDAAEAAFGRAVELAERARRRTGARRSACVRSAPWSLAGSRLVRRAGPDGRDLRARGAVAAGEDVEDVLARAVDRAARHGGARAAASGRSRSYERIGDRTGVMSTVIAMAYLSYAPVIHLASSARHIEEIRRVIARLPSS